MSTTLTTAESKLLVRIRELQPVSIARLRLKGPELRTFRRLLDKEVVVPAGAGMLGTNWSAKD